MQNAVNRYRLGLCALAIMAGGYVSAQDMASPSFKVRAAAMSAGGSDVPAGAGEMGVSSNSFKSIYALGLNVVDTGEDASASFRFREGYLHTLNAPPRKLADLLRLPENDSFIYTNQIAVGLTNAGDPDGSAERLHMQIQVADDPAFTNIVGQMDSRAGGGVWQVAKGGLGNAFTAFPGTGLGGTETADYAKVVLQLPAGNYYWRMRASDTFFDLGGWTTAFRFAVDPPQPVIVSPADGALLVVAAPTLDWGDLAGVPKYEVQVGTDAAFAAVVRDTQPGAAAQPDPPDDANPAASVWTATPALPDGVYFWHVRGVDALDNPIGPFSNTGQFQVSTAAPVITSPGNGTILQDNTPTISGTATPGYPVQVLDGAAILGGTAADGAGIWNFASPVLAPGNHTITARLGPDPFGNTGPASAGVTFTVDAVIAAVVMEPASADVPGGSVVTLRAELRNAGGGVVVPNSAADIAFTIQSGAGTLGAPLLVSDRIEVTYTTALGAENAVIRAREARSGNNFFDDSTIRAVGSFAVTAGPLNPGAKAAAAGSAGVAVLQFRLAASGENVRVTAITFSGSGTGNEQAHVAQVRLVEDLNGSGGFEAGTDRVIAAAGRYGADDGTVTFGGLAEDIPGGGARTWLVAYDFDATTTVDTTFGISLTPGTQIAALGVQSGNPIAAGGALFGGGPVTVTAAPTIGSLTLSDGTNNPPASRQPADAQKVELTQILLQAGGVEDVRVTGISVTALGTGIDTTDVATVTVYRDANGNGIFDAGTDTGIATAGAFGVDNGTRAFGGLNVVIPKGGSETWLVVYDLSGTGAAGATFQARVDAAGILATGVTSGTAIAAGGFASVTGGVVTLATPGTAGSLSILTGAQNPGSQTIVPDAQNVVGQQFALAASGVENVTVSQMRVSVSGSGEDFRDVTGVTLAEDVNGSGLFDAGLDVVLGAPDVPFSGNDGTATFGGLAVSIPKGGYRQFIVVLDFSGTAVAGSNFRVCLAANTDVTATGAVSAAAIVPSGAPTCGGTAEIGAAGAAGNLRIRLGPNNPPASNQLNGAQDVEMFQAELLVSDFEDVRVTAVAVTGTGTGNEVGHLLGASLVEDANSNGTFDAGIDRTVAPNTAFFADEGKVSFSGLSEVIPAGTSRRYLLVYDFNGAVPVGSTFTARIAAAGDVSAQGVTSGQAIAPFGLPVDGSPVTIAASGTPGSLSIALGARTPAAQFVATNASFVSVLQLSFSASSLESLAVTSLRFRADGTGDDAADLAGATLVEDVNRNGLLDVGTDRVLGPAAVAYSADNGTATFAFGGGGEVIASGQTEEWLLVYNFSGAAANDATFRALFDPAADVACTGLGSGAAITASGASITSATVTTGTVGSGGVRGTVAVAAGPFPLIAQEVAAFAHGVSMLQWEIRAGSLEAVKIESLRIRASGVGNEAADVRTVLLVADVDENGLFEEGRDRVIAQAASPFGADNGRVTFADLAEVVAANGRVTWLLVYNFTGRDDPGARTFQAALAPDQDVGARGMDSDLPIVPSGGSLTGPVIALRRPAGSKGGSDAPVSCWAGGAAPGAWGWSWAILGVGLAWRGVRRRCGSGGRERG